MSQQDELDMGRQADIQIQKLYLVNQDPKENAWVDRIGERLVPCSDRPDIPYVFRVLDDPTVNAFSVPGYIYIDAGLLSFIKNDRDRDNELAGVIAHELGHIGGRHIAKQVEEQQGGSVLGVLAGWATHGKFHNDVDLGADLYLLGHDSCDECDADQRAVNNMVRAGIDPEGYMIFLRKAQAESQSGKEFIPYLQTDPLSGDRMEKLEQDIEQDRLHGAPPPQAG